MQKIKLKVKTLNKGSELMIKKMAWETFKNTGDIYTFMELKQIENWEKGIVDAAQVLKKNENADCSFDQSNDDKS